MKYLLRRLTRFELRHARAIVWAAALIALASLPLVAQLRVDGRFAALLPQDAPSVRDLEQAQTRMSGLETLTIAVESPSGDVANMELLATALAPELAKIPGVVRVDYRTGARARFIHEHLARYASAEQLDELNAALAERLDAERARANPFYVDLDDESEGEDALDRALDDLRVREQAHARGGDGYYLSEDEHALVMFVRSDLRGGESRGGRALFRSARATADAALRGRRGDLSVGIGGSVKVALDEADAIGGELLLATSVTVLCVLLAIFLFFRRARAIALLGAALAAPVLLTFAIAALAVGSLNTSTAFLASIVIGNGVNPNIIWLARFFEERRRGRSLRSAVLRTHAGVLLATATASGAAAIAYGSLVITDFRGFRDFGLIGFVGMALSWLGAIVLLPALTIVWERRTPLALGRERGARFGRGFAALAERMPRSVLGVSLILSVLSIGAASRAWAADPMEYDFRRLTSDREESEAKRVTHIAHAIVGDAAQGNGMLLLTPSVDEARRLRRTLAQAADNDLFGQVRSLEDLLPRDSPEMRARLTETGRLLGEIRPHADAQTRTRIDEVLGDLRAPAPTLDDLPEELASAYTERDGSRGRALSVTASHAHSLWDGRYLVRWTRGMRELRLTTGERPLLLGRGPVFADMLVAIGRDGSRAVLLSLLATLALVALTFRQRRSAAAVISGLLLGVLWMAGAMAMLGMKLNFLDFVAFPITFGNGADYGVNVIQRYRLERHRGAREALRAAVSSSGGAVALCSLTTILGYGSLFISANRAVRSFGGAMVLSELTCLLAALLTVPAFGFFWLRRSSRSGASRRVQPARP